MQLGLSYACLLQQVLLHKDSSSRFYLNVECHEINRLFDSLDVYFQGVHYLGRGDRSIFLKHLDVLLAEEHLHSRLSHFRLVNIPVGLQASLHIFQVVVSALNLGLVQLFHSLNQEIILLFEHYAT